ncbi:globin-coupled sensor protein [uncultured Devosia sp.]|mgnify:CR=1 FL=1|uniref:globin-coupled sensor protein n=1 Tax=uncultured Devosia sp. TaxID=211434 RepID=UPI00261C24E1|nr:globin-coupled sensor protein [uncultured Devosia sp.]
MSLQQNGSAADLAGRLDFIGLDAEARDRIAALKPLIDRHMGGALDSFYAKVANVEQMAHMFEAPGVIEHAKSRQAAHWGNIAAGQLDDKYFATSSAIGEVHARIGLEPKWYIGGYALIVEELLKRVSADYFAEATQGRSRLGLRRAFSAADMAGFVQTVSELVKAVMLDIDIGVSTYFHRLTAETTALNTKICAVVDAAKAGDFTERVEIVSSNPAISGLAANVNGLMGTIQSGIAATTEALEALAKADLTKRMEGDFEGAFKSLQDDTNAVRDRLADIVGQLKQTSGGLKLATGEILAGANDLSERTTKQAATIEETSAAMEQVASSVGRNAAQTQQASRNGATVRDAARQGEEVMSQASHAMERITTSSSKIANIIGLIDDIAFQTNLLALNASVEAARAGEAGKGFAVVAVEVRRLAQSAAQASSEVKALIDQSGQEVANGSQLVTSAVEKLRLIVGAIEENTQLMDDIARASQEQASAIDDVNSAVRQLDDMTQHNAALVEQTNASIEKTEAQAHDLDSIVNLFSLTDLPEGHAEQPQRRPPAAPSPKPGAALSYLSQGNAAISTDWDEF